MFLGSCIEHRDCTETCKLVYPDSIDRNDSRAGMFSGSLGQRSELLSTLAHREHEGNSKEMSAMRADQKVKAVGDKDTSAHSKNVLGHLLYTSSIFGPDDWKPISCWARQMCSWRATSGLAASVKHTDPTRPFPWSNQMWRIGKTDLLQKCTPVIK